MSHEYVGNLHVHSVYSDGFGLHEEIARAALDAGLDFVVVTDHNVLVEGVEGYWYRGRKRVLLLTGEEVHDQSREPQKNHLLVYEARKELAPLAHSPARLLEAVKEAGGLAFIAHPFDVDAPLFGEGDLSWVTWDVDGYHGLEIWNYMVEYKACLTSWPSAIYYAYRPNGMVRGPRRETLETWDHLLAAGKKVYAIGGSDAHAYPARKGPLHRIVFPYAFLFRTVNTHVLTEEPLEGDPEADRQRLRAAMARGSMFVGYDLHHNTRGFRFTAEGDRGSIPMGGTVHGRFGVTLRVRSPLRARLRLIHNGNLIRTWEDTDNAVVNVSDPGAYRVEVRLPQGGREKPWIYSNPIFVEVTVGRRA